MKATLVKSKILIVGSNPSVKSPDQSAFHISTRSRIVLDGWFKDFAIEDMAFMNIVNEKKEDNKPLNAEEIRSGLPVISEQLEKYKDYKIVTVGNTAKKALTLLRVDFYEMPHPSGLNRLLNDKNYVAEKIKGLSEFLTTPLNQ